MLIAGFVMLNQNQDSKGTLKATVCLDSSAGPFYKVLTYSIYIALFLVSM